MLHANMARSVALCPGSMLGLTGPTLDAANRSRSPAMGLMSDQGSWDGSTLLAAKSAIPRGYTHPTAWVLPRVGGDLASSYHGIVGTASVSANLAGGYNLAADLTGTSSVTAALGLIVSAVAALSGSATITAAITGKLEAAAALTGSADKPSSCPEPSRATACGSSSTVGRPSRPPARSRCWAWAASSPLVAAADSPFVPRSRSPLSTRVPASSSESPPRPRHSTRRGRFAFPR